MVARKYYPGFKCLDCGLDWIDRTHNFNADRCSKCYQRRYRANKDSKPRKPYTRPALTEKGYRSRIRKIAESYVPKELRPQFLRTYIKHYNPHRQATPGGTR